MRVSLIAALSLNRAIGRANALPWHLPNDLRRFRSLTMGHPLVLGRRTFEAIGRPLPGRRLIVVSRRAGFRPDGVEVCASVDEALHRAAAEEVFVGGGAEIFEQTLPRAGRLHLTVVEAVVEGDTFFPPYDESAWHTVQEERFPADERHAWPYRFVTCDRMA